MTKDGKFIRKSKTSAERSSLTSLSAHPLMEVKNLKRMFKNFTYSSGFAIPYVVLRLFMKRCYAMMESSFISEGEVNA